MIDEISRSGIWCSQGERFVDAFGVPAVQQEVAQGTDVAMAEGEQPWGCRRFCTEPRLRERMLRLRQRKSGSVTLMVRQPCSLLHAHSLAPRSLGGFASGARCAPHARMTCMRCAPAPLRLAWSAARRPTRAVVPAMQALECSFEGREGAPEESQLAGARECATRLLIRACRDDAAVSAANGFVTQLKLALLQARARPLRPPPAACPCRALLGARAWQQRMRGAPTAAQACCVASAVAAC